MLSNTYDLSHTLEFDFRGLQNRKCPFERDLYGNTY